MGRRIPGKMDVVDAAKRSKMMAGIKSKNTGPEMMVRKYLHAKGFRYRLHARKLPGSPDVVLPKHKVVIFVHGCFWHRHLSCRFATHPSSNAERWSKKFQENIDRDARNSTALDSLGWNVLVVWECELRVDSAGRLERLVSEISSHLPRLVGEPHT